jgi:hypothetical protein
MTGHSWCERLCAAAQVSSPKARLVEVLRIFWPMPDRAFYSALARSILAGEAALEPIVVRASSTLGRNWRWLRPMARRYLLAFSSDQRPRHKAVISFLTADEGLRSAFYHYGTQVRIANWLRGPNRMQPVHAARR